MPFCSTCGQQHVEGARFCAACGASLAAPEPARETRKVVTVVFCDLAGSTALGERLDPEALRAVLGRYFATVSGALRRHGGTVEKFIGDAVMCVFGIPRVHEDDALRAVRAAWEMTGAMARLNKELEAEWGVRLEVRTGVNTGAVVAGDPASGQALVTGDTVNTAARLEQAAGAGEVLLGPLTHELVRDAVRAEALAPLALKGKAEPVAAWRLLEPLPDAPPRAPGGDAPLLGRAGELGRLEAALEEAVSDERLGVVTVLGAAGLGKSRLADEFLRRLAGRARVLRGHCPAYGESMTFLPVRELVEQAAGAVDPEALGEVMLGHPQAARVADTVMAALAGGELGAIQEAFFALEELLVHLARREPLVVVLEDVHWAAPALLDFLERLAARDRTARLLVLCLARPELLEDRPGWSEPDSRMELVELEALTGEEAEALLTRAAGSPALLSEVRERILRAAEGNPLYLEQMAALLAERGASEAQVAVPPTIQALLAARIDRLPPLERAVAERGAVVGRQFWRRAVSELCPPPEQPALAERLGSLVRGRLIAGGAPDTDGEETYSFRHVLLRDAAYEAMPKGLRADLHERFADWFAARPDEGERDEILGHHLEQAHRYRAELRPTDAEGLALAARAAGHLAAAGRRAMARCDYPAVANLLERAVVLWPAGNPKRLAVLPTLGEALTHLGRFAAASEALQEVLGSGDRSGNPSTHFRALLARTDLDLCLGTGTLADMEKAAREAIPVFAAREDERGLALAHLRLGQAAVFTGRVSEARPALEEALVRAERSGDRERGLFVLSLLAGALAYGSEPLSTGIAWCEDVLGRHPEDRLVHGALGFELSEMLAMSGRFDAAREVLALRLRTLQEIGFRLLVPVHRAAAAHVELLAGDHRAAEREARAGYEELEALGDRESFPTLAVLRAEALLGLGDLDAAEACLRAGAEVASSESLEQSNGRRVHARILARRGDGRRAVELAREAVDLAARTDWILLRADTLLGLAEVLHLSGDAAGAVHPARAAFELYEKKEHVVGATRASRLLGGDARSG